MSIVVNETKIGYKLVKNREKINHLLFMNDLKLYTKNENELDSLVQTVKIFSEDIGMQFGIQKCAMIEMKRGRMVSSEGIDLPNRETMKSAEDKYCYATQLKVRK